MNKRLKQKNKRTEPKEDVSIIISFFEILTEFLGAATIVISLTGFSAIIGFVITLIITGKAGFTLMTIFVCSGFVLSIIYAIYIWRTKGTVNFISNSSWQYNDTKAKD